MFSKILSVFIVMVILFAKPLLSQNNTALIDSLEKATSNAKLDTASLNTILKRLDNPQIRHLSKTDSIGKVILNQFNKINYTDGIYRAIDFMAVLNYKKGNYKTALDYHKELLAMFENKRIDASFEAKTYKFITGEYLNTGNFDSAIIFGEKTVAKYIHLKDSQNIASSLNLLGGIHWNKGSLKKASEKLYESLVIREKLNDTLGVANSYNNIGLIYDSQNKLTEAIEMYSKALDLYKKTNNDDGFGRACNNIAIVMKNQGRYSESIEMFMKSLETDKRTNHIDDQGKTLNNIGLLYIEIKDYLQGIEYLNQAHKAFIQSGNENGIAAVYINLGKAYINLNKYSYAENYYRKSLDIAKKIGSNEWLRDSYEGLYKVLKATGKHSHALAFHEKYKELNDSLRSIESLNKLDQLKIEFETDQKEKEIALLSKDNELNALKLKRQESYTHLLLTIIASIALILILASMHLKRLNADKKILLLKNTEITQQKEEILAQRDLLETTNAELLQQKEELQANTEQIEKQNRLISGINNRLTESIEYASLIQQTLLPSTSVFDKYFCSQFVLYKPKDIVSGDLYWAWEIDNDIIFAIADCTGHGVAGAFVSVMAISLLKDAVGVNRLTEPKDISAYLYNEMRKNTYSEFNSALGIDFVICRYSRASKNLIYSGNHINFIVNKDETMELIKVRKSTNSTNTQPTFPQETLKLETKNRIYFYTDGYTDQLSAVRRKKMGRSEFQLLLQQIATHPHSLHQEMIENFYDKWKGNFEQVDDVLVVGLEV